MVDNKNIIEMNKGEKETNLTFKKLMQKLKTKVFEVTEDKEEEILVYFGDERGNIRVLNISHILKEFTVTPIQKVAYYPSQKTSFILDRKGYYQIDSISKSLIRTAESQQLPEFQSYREL